MVGRFVEQQQVRAAQQRARQVQSHAPAAGEVGDRPLEVGRRESEPVHHGGRARTRRVAVDCFEPGVQVRERVAVVGTVGCREPALDVAQLHVAVQYVVDGRLLECRRFLADGCDPPVPRHFAVARFRVQLAAQQREQARLATAIGADETDAPACVHLQVRILDEPPRAARERELPEQDQGSSGFSRAGRAF